MKTVFAYRVALFLGGIAALSACVSAPPPASRPTPEPAPPPPSPEPVAKDWRSWPVAAGDWSYRAIAGSTLASFGQRGQQPLLVIRCETATRRIFVARALPAPASGQMTVRTSFGAAQWPVDAGAQAGVAGIYAVAPRANNDATLDQIAFSRGRFAIEAPGASPLAVPNWAEASRVIEDCRG